MLSPLSSFTFKHMAFFIRLILTFGIILFGFAYTRTDAPEIPDATDTMASDAAARAWADSMYTTMTLDERIGQLLQIRAHSDLGAQHEADVRRLIQQYHVGSLCFFQGTPRRQLELTNEYQAMSKIPMLIAMDAEWGLGMRFKKDAMSFPRQMTLGAIQDDHVIYEMGKEVAHQMSRIGVHINFAPVVDVNNNKNNPVINDRSFGEREELVTRKALQYMKGMQDAGVIACAKHFPGHGDTDADSHYDLPVIKHDMARLDSIELKPFHRLIAGGVKSIMVAHLQIPAIDPAPNTPTTLSAKTVNDLLKVKMGFDGLIFTDAMEMKGVTKHYASGEAEAIAIAVGNDMLCLPNDVGMAVSAIKNYIADGRISEQRLAESVKKILKSKYEIGLTTYTPISTENVENDLFLAHAIALNKKLKEKALTLVRDDQSVLPIKNITTDIGVLEIGAKENSAFKRRMEAFGHSMFYRMSKGGGTEALLQKLVNKKHVIVAFHDMSKHQRKRFGIDQKDVDFLNRLASRTKVTVVLFGNPYSLQYFDQIGTAVVGYEADDVTQEAMAQALNGARDFLGKLPVTASPRARSGMGLTPNSIFRMGFAEPEEVGMSSIHLAALDTLMDEIIDRKAAPGGQILVVKDNQVVYQKSYGFHTYEKNIPVENHHIYDLASVTKILASTYSLMKLFDRGDMSVFQPLKKYLPELDTTNKKGIVIEDMLTHTAQLRPWIPFYENTLNSKKRPSVKYYNKKKEEPFTIPVAKNLYIHRAYQDSIWNQIFTSELLPYRRYRYSDLGFFMADRLVQRISGQRIDQFANEQFYRPLGLSRTMYNPLGTIPENEIAPTEEDKYFRYQRLQGYVHDMGAAMRGGVSGHAGLFSNAYEVGIMMQNLLNGGYYAGKRYFHPVTVSLFTARPDYETRRGLGFDMKQLDPSKNLNMSPKASYRTFGHLGFTGTCAWADPMHNLVFVFLSNRTYPDMKNNLLGRDDYRPKLQSIVYAALNPNQSIQ